LAGPAPDGDDHATMTERRTRRSQVPVEALAMFLESQRTKLEARGLAVTTGDGQLLAAAGEPIQAHEARDDAARKTTNIATWSLRLGRVEVILASHGGRLSHDVGSGVRRILAGDAS
jgi:hypothetical protein